MNRFAVIDLGTNTFHLLIVDMQKGAPTSILFKKRIYVSLASEGISNIGDAPYARGLNCLNQFASIMKEYQVDAIRLLGQQLLGMQEMLRIL